MNDICSSDTETEVPTDQSVQVHSHKAAKTLNPRKFISITPCSQLATETEPPSTVEPPEASTEQSEEQKSVEICIKVSSLAHAIMYNK